MKMQAFPQSGAPEGAADIANVTPGLAVFAAALTAEAFDAVPEEQARGFFLSVGGRIAGFETLDGVNDVSGLSARVNAFWLALGWGEADFAVGSDAIIVRHRDGPSLLPLPDASGDGAKADAAKHWRVALGAVLEGAYDSWFRMLGSGPTLVTVAEWKSETLELRHGR